MNANKIEIEFSRYSTEQGTLLYKVYILDAYDGIIEKWIDIDINTAVNKIAEYCNVSIN